MIYVRVSQIILKEISQKHKISTSKKEKSINQHLNQQEVAAHI